MAFEYGSDVDELDEILLAGEDDSMEYGRARGGSLARRTEYTRKRRLVCGIGSVTVGADGSAQLTVSPQVPFRIKRLVLSATDLGGLLVTDIRVGKNSQLVSTDPVAAIAFGSETTGAIVDFDAAGPGTTITVDITDISGAANVVSGTFFGEAAER